MSQYGQVAKKIKQRQARNQEAKNAARQGRGVKEVSIKKPVDRSSQMVRDITRRARAENPPIIRTRSTLRPSKANRSAGLRAAPSSNIGGISSRIKQLEAEIAAKNKAKMRGAAARIAERRRRAASVKLGD